MTNSAGNILLRAILRISHQLIRRALPNSARLRQMMAEEGFVFQIRTMSGGGGYFELNNGQLVFKSAQHPNPTLEQVWTNGGQAVRTMLSRDETDLLRAFESGYYSMNGDFTKALWFNEAMKIARAM